MSGDRGVLMLSPPPASSNPHPHHWSFGQDAPHLLHSTDYSHHGGDCVAIRVIHPFGRWLKLGHGPFHCQSWSGGLLAAHSLHQRLGVGAAVDKREYHVRLSKVWGDRWPNRQGSWEQQCRSWSVSPGIFIWVFNGYRQLNVSICNFGKIYFQIRWHSIRIKCTHPSVLDV